VALTVGELAVELEARNQDFEVRIRQAERSLGRFEQTAERRTAAVASSFGRLRGSLASVTTGFGSIIAVLGVGGVAAAAKRAANELDTIGDTADRLGITTDALQELQFAAAAADVTSEGLASSLQFLSRAIGQARAGTGALRANLERTNPELLKQLTATTDVERQFQLLTGAIADAANQQDALTLAAAGFGRGAGPQLATVALQGADAFDQLRQRARDAGVVIDEQIIRTAGQTSDELALLSRIITANLNKALVSAGPLLTTFAANLATGAQAVSLFFDSFREVGTRSTANIETQIGILLTDIERVETRMRALGVTQAVETARRVGIEPRLTGEGAGLLEEQRRLQARIDALQTELRAREAKPAPTPGAADVLDVEAEKERARSAKALAEEQTRNAERLVDLQRQLRIERLQDVEPLQAQAQAISDQIEDVQALKLDTEGRATADELVNQLLERRAELEQRLAAATLEQRVGMEELETQLRTLAQLDRERGAAIRDAILARIAEAEGAEAVAEAIREGLDRAKRETKEEQDELAIDIGQAIGEGVAGGIRQALKDTARGDVPEFADVLGNLSGTFLDTAIDATLAGLDKKLEGIFDQLTGAIGGLFGEGGAGPGLESALAGALGVGLSLAAGALRDTESSVRREAIRSAVTSAQEVRGIVAGPTDIPIFQVGESIEQSFVPVVAQLQTSNVILRAILAAVASDDPSTARSARAILEAAAGELAATTSPTLT